MDERSVLIDHVTGLHVGWYFWLRVLDEVGRSDRYGSPFALLLLDADVPPKGAQHALGAVPGVIRGTDLGGVLGPSQAGVILTNQDAEGAVAAVERIVSRLPAVTGVAWQPRLLCYPRDAAAVSHLLTHEERQRAAV